jgi:hypothetical protein
LSRIFEQLEPFQPLELFEPLERLSKSVNVFSYFFASTLPRFPTFPLPGGLTAQAAGTVQAVGTVLFTVYNIRKTDDGGGLPWQRL